MRLNKMTGLLALVAVFCAGLLLAFSRPAGASEAVLSHLNDGMDSSTTLESTSHYVAFDAPKGWTNRFSQSLDVYCQRYGDVSGIKGIVVFYQAPTDKTDITTPYTILGRKLFDLSDAPEQMGWFSVPLDTFELPERFGVAVFTFSNETRGLRVGYTRKVRDNMSSSYVMKPDGTLDRKYKPNMSREGREWMLRLTLRNTLAPQASLSSGEIHGSMFGGWDDGSAETFVTVQKHGCLVHFKNASPREVSRVYIYGQAAGDWLKSGQNIAVSLLDNEMGILHHVTLPYTAYTNEPSWAYVDFPTTNTPAEFYVLVEPNSRPMAQFEIGTDTSGMNKGSSWAVIGAHLEWETDAPQDKSNFMIRVEYK